MRKGLATQKVIEQYDAYVMKTYARSPLVITKGKGSRVWDIEGREYLDLFPGWGVSGLGYNHPWVVRALRGQITRVIHVSNNYFHPLQSRAAKKLLELSFDGQVFFVNSGAEAVETAIKLARRWAHQISAGSGANGSRTVILTTERSFHGRTLGALSATGQRKYQEGFDPLLPGFKAVPFGNLQALQSAISSDTCAVIIEPIQGEGGVNVPDAGYLKEVRQLCDSRGLLLIADEVQTGMGRTGSWFAYQHSGIEPDILLLAKALGGGFPISAVIAKRSIAPVLGPGTHGSTYAGNPLGCACILAVIEAIEKQGLLKHVDQLSRYLWSRLQSIKEKVAIVKEVRGQGFMAGIELNLPGRNIVDACREKGLLINCTQERILRLLPALNITKAQLSRGLGVLEQTLKEAAAGATPVGKQV